MREEQTNRAPHRSFIALKHWEPLHTPTLRAAETWRRELWEYLPAPSSCDHSANTAGFSVKKIGVALCALAALVATAFSPLPEAHANGCIFTNFGGGIGTAGDPLQVATPAHLKELQSDSNCWGYEFLQTANISMGGTTWSSGIGGTFPGTFAGIYNGAGHSISSLTITVPGGVYVGLFTQLSSAGVIQNLSFEGNVTAESYVGGMIGRNLGTIENSFVGGSAVITATSAGVYPAGLVGLNGSTGVIRNTYSAATVASPVLGAGLVGNHDTGGTVTNSYSVGAVTGILNKGLIATGAGAVNDSFWDTQTSGTAASQSGTGKTTSEMQSISTFSAWSITDTWSASNIWGICSAVNSGYPFLTVFYSSNPCVTSPSPSSSSPEPAVLELFLSPTDGTVCNSRSESGAVGTWVSLPSANDCTPPAAIPNALLFGWATTPDFPIEIAQRQVNNGWGAYEIFDDEGRLTAVFIPSGGSTALSSAGELYPIWDS